MVYFVLDTCRWCTATDEVRLINTIYPENYKIVSTIWHHFCLKLLINLFTDHPLLQKNPEWITDEIAVNNYGKTPHFDDNIIIGKFDFHFVQIRSPG